MPAAASSLKGRGEAEQDSGESGNQNRESERDAIQTNFFDAGKIARIPGAQGGDSGVGEDASRLRRPKWRAANFR